MPFTTEQGLNEVLETLSNLHPKKIDLSLGRLKRLLKTLGNPETKLPPVIHVAGTNGKGSVIANLRALLEAAGLRVQVYTSPHLVSFRERIRLAGELISEKDLIEVLHRVEVANHNAPITFFEITTAAAFLAFSETPADVLLLEVGLGGKFDATNVIKNPLLTIITPVGLDHAEFLGTEIKGVATEKAGIIKTGVPLITGPQDPEVLKVLTQTSKDVEAPLFHEGRDWTIDENNFFWGFGRELNLPKLALAGRHQTQNAGIALAALFCQDKFEISNEACLKGLQNTNWPARFQALNPDQFNAALTVGTNIWLDGGHNPLAGKALGFQLSKMASKHTTAIVGMMAGKDIKGFLEPLAPHLERLIAVPVPGEENGAPPKTILAAAKALGLGGQIASSVEEALALVAKGQAPNILITGSLYLAGSVLKDIGFIPA
ncbi:MAG: bifunctional folylpolyglutamate synthase/dihydrofolate synthase [Alphaproteobacteria bacterium]